MEVKCYLKVALNQKREKLANHGRAYVFFTLCPLNGSLKSLKSSAKTKSDFWRLFFMKKVVKGLPEGALKAAKHHPKKHQKNDAFLRGSEGEGDADNETPGGEARRRNDPV